jgi:hypothetical protein
MPATVALMIDPRAEVGVSGAHGKRPSAQFVATLSPKLRSFAGKTDELRSR